MLIIFHNYRFVAVSNCTLDYLYAILDRVYYLSLFCNCFCLLLYFGKVGGKFAIEMCIFA